MLIPMRILIIMAGRFSFLGSTGREPESGAWKAKPDRGNEERSAVNS